MADNLFQLKAYIGVVIRRLAAENDLIQAHLARAMDRAPGTVAQWWNGKVMPDTDSLVAIAKALGTTHADLMQEAERLLQESLGDTPAREMQNAPATVRNPEPRWYPMTAEEETVIFPLVRAVQELYRNYNADLFAHLLNQVGFLFDNADKRSNPQIAIALDAFEAIQKRAALRPDTGERRSEPNRRAAVATKRRGK